MLMIFWVAFELDSQIQSDYLWWGDGRGDIREMMAGPLVGAQMTQFVHLDAG